MSVSVKTRCLNPPGTLSAKTEVFSRNIEKMKYDDCPSYPTWMEPVERLGGPTTRYPLHIASNHPVYRLHSQLCGTKLREKYAVGEREPCRMNLEEACGIVILPAYPMTGGRFLQASG